MPLEPQVVEYSHCINCQDLPPLLLIDILIVSSLGFLFTTTVILPEMDPSA